MRPSYITPPPPSHAPCPSLSTMDLHSPKLVLPPPPPPPPRLPELLVRVLQDKGQYPLYTHQAESCRQLFAGNNVVVATRECCFLLPLSGTHDSEAPPLRSAVCGSIVCSTSSSSGGRRKNSHS